MPSPQKFNLQITGADEDVPRLLAAGGSGCGGLVGFVARPLTGEAVLVHQPKSGKGEDPDMKRSGKVWVSDVALLPSRLGVVGKGTQPVDHPAAPSHVLKASEAIDLLQILRAKLPEARPGGIKGTWSGRLECSGDVPVVVLERKVASYGVLRLTSSPRGWTPTLERQGRWFAGQKSVTGATKHQLAEAIGVGLHMMLQPIGEACAVRDTRRRNTMDAAYAEKHPPKAGKAPRREPTANVEKRLAKSEETRRPRPKAQRVPPLSEVAAPMSPSCPSSAATIAKTTQSDAKALGELVGTVWGEQEVPELLKRAAGLIKAGQALAMSALCTGDAKKEAMGHLHKAIQAYEDARQRLAAGDVDATTKRGIKHIAEEVGLAAAKAARGCVRQAAPKKAAPAKGGPTKSAPARETPKKAPTPRTPKAAPAAEGTGKGRSSRKAAPAVDPEKDKILMGAFSGAVVEAMRQMKAQGLLVTGSVP